MRDQYGRTIEYMRVSVTDRCNLRCVYCMPEKGVPSVPHNEILTVDEISRICRIGVSLGISRITGKNDPAPQTAASVQNLFRILDRSHAYLIQLASGKYSAGCKGTIGGIKNLPRMSIVIQDFLGTGRPIAKNLLKQDPVSCLLHHQTSFP